MFVVYCWMGQKKKGMYSRIHTIVVVLLLLFLFVCSFVVVVFAVVCFFFVIWSPPTTTITPPQKIKSRPWKGNQLLVYLHFLSFPFFKTFLLQQLGLTGIHSPAHTDTPTARTPHGQIIIFFVHFTLSQFFLFLFLTISTYPPHTHTHTRSPRIILTHIE